MFKMNTNNYYKELTIKIASDYSDKESITIDFYNGYWWISHYNNIKIWDSIKCNRLWFLFCILSRTYDYKFFDGYTR